MSRNISEMKKQVAIPLINLQLDKEATISLGDSKIVPIKEVSRDVASAVRLGAGMQEYTVSMSLDYVLQTQSHPNGLEATLNHALTVFKLYKDSMVLSHVIFDVTGNTIHEMRHYVPYARIPIGKYSLSKLERKRFVEFWKEFRGLNPTNFAVYRFHLADFRPYLYDRFVDYVESLESLLVPDYGGKEAEIRFKFASRGALILGARTSAEQRRTIFRRLQNAYDLRSQIVHAGPPSENELGKIWENADTWEDVIPPIRSDNRELIKFIYRAGCLDQGEKRGELFRSRLVFEPRMRFANPREFMLGEPTGFSDKVRKRLGKT
jgi:hypothetical protein